MEQNTPEWLEFRRNKIGASDCPAILGISPYKTPYQLWEEKVFRKQQEQNSAMARGHMMEEEARQEFEKLTGIAVMPKVMVHLQRDWQMASFDGVSFDGEIFVEIKCPNAEIHQMAEDGRIPAHYYAQLQHQMCVIDAKQGYYFSYNGRKGALVPVNRDDSYIETIIEKESKFLECMTSKSAPELTDQDYVEQSGQEWKKISEELKTLRECIQSMEDKEAILRKRTIEISSGRNSKGAGMRLTRSICKGSVDYKKIPELIGIDLEVYRKPPIEKWTLSTCK